MSTAKRECDVCSQDVQYSIYVRERIERAREELNQGQLIEQDEIEIRMRRWLDESRGRNQPGRNSKVRRVFIERDMRPRWSMGQGLPQGPCGSLLNAEESYPNYQTK